MGMRGNTTGLTIQIFPIRKQVVLHTQKRRARLSDLFLVALSDVGSVGSANVYAEVGQRHTLIQYCRQEGAVRGLT